MSLKGGLGGKDWPDWLDSEIPNSLVTYAGVVRSFGAYCSAQVSKVPPVCPSHIVERGQWWLEKYEPYLLLVWVSCFKGIVLGSLKDEKRILSGTFSPKAILGGA